jgi:hypothetical protein
MLAGLAALSNGAWARTKLVALPARGETVIRLDNERATLIEEERVLTLQKGVNKVDFSWVGVNIDPDSIRLAPLTHPDKVALLNVSFPPGEAALVWEISSPEAWEEKVRISYLLRGIDRLVTYRGVADKAEKALDLRSFIVLRNFSGEDFSQARVILDAAQGFEQSIQHEETKQLLHLSLAGVPVEKVWKFDTALLPWDPKQVDRNVGVPVYYKIANDSKAGLGKAALGAGKIRLYMDDGHGGTIFAGEDNTKLVPVGEKMEVYVGDSRDLVVTQRKMSERKINLRKNTSGAVVLYDSEEVIEAKIENFKTDKARLVLVQHLPGQWEMKECNLPYTRKDADTFEFEIELPPNGKTDLKMHYLRRNLRPGMEHRSLMTF